MAALDSGKLTAAERTAAIQSFEALGVCTQLAEAAASLGWKAPSNIQEQAVPALLEGTVLSLLFAAAASFALHMVLRTDLCFARLHYPANSSPP